MSCWDKWLFGLQHHQTLPEFIWRYTFKAFKKFKKITQVIDPNGISSLADRNISVFQQLFCHFHALLYDKINRADAEFSLKSPEEAWFLLIIIVELS